MSDAYLIHNLLYSLSHHSPAAMVGKLEHSIDGMVTRYDHDDGTVIFEKLKKREFDYSISTVNIHD